MADLDNFFAKKDRKKTKGGQKFATSDNMATSQEELQKKQEKQKKDRVLLQSLHSSENDDSNSKVIRFLLALSVSVFWFWTFTVGHDPFSP